MANAVYDPDTEGEQRYHPPNLDPLDNKPAGDSSDPRTIHNRPESAKSDSVETSSDLRDAESGGDGFYNPQGDHGEPSGSGGSGSLLDRESGGSGDHGSRSSGFKFNDSDKGGRLGAAMKMVAKHKKGVGIGAGVGGGLVGIALMIFFMLIPLKIEHIVQNLENRFFATSEDAVSRESAKMFTRYMTKYVLPQYRGKCGSTIDRNCSVKINGKGPVSNLYRTWANAKLENDLAKNYGIEFKFDSHSGHWHMKAPGTNSGGDDIGADGKGLDTDFERSNRSEMRAAVKDAFQHETRWKKVMYRYKVGRLLEEKYGLKRCIIFCGTRDKLADKKDAKLNAAKLKLVQRVITPRTESLGPILECLIAGCNPTKVSPIPAEDGTTGELAGSPENHETDTQIREIDQQLSQRFATETLESMTNAVDRIREKGPARWLLETVLTKAGLSDMLAKQLSSAVPIVGWAERIATLIHFARHAGPALQKLSYIANAGAAVQLYMMYRTYADEIHTGHVDATEVGSLTDSLSPGNRGTPGDPQVGGTAGAENTPLYKNLIDHENGKQSVALLNNLLPGKAEAATGGSNSPDYICQNGKPVPTGQLACSEEAFGSVQGLGSAALSASQFLAEPVVSSVSSVADTIYNASNGVYGVIGDVAGWVIHNVPPFNLAADGATAATSFLLDKLQPFFMDVLNKLIKNPFSDNMSGGRTFDLMAAGADVAGNDYAHTVLGGQKLNPQQVADIVNQQQDLAQQEFNHQSFFARMFDTSSDYSLVTKIAMSIPIGTQAQAQRGLANILNPLEALGHGFASLFSGKVLAAATAQPDPFGIVQYGYTSDDLNNIGDPETYWEQHCSDNASNAYMKTNDWNKAAAKTIDPNTGMPVNTKTNPCLLLKATVGAAGGLFNTSNLTSDDLADQTGGSSVTGGSAIPVSGNAQQLAQQILSNNNIDLGCLSSSVGQDVKDAAAGKPGTAGAAVSSAILQLIATVGQNHQVCITAIESDGQGHATGSYHYTGDAVDFGSLDGVTITGRNAPAITIIDIATKIMPDGSALGQSQCGSTPPLPSGWTTFEDTCNHLHIQVPRGTK
jgi:hypothetical protein